MNRYQESLAGRAVLALEKAAGGIAAMGRAAEKLAAVAERSADALIPAMVARLEAGASSRRLEGAVIRSLPLEVEEEPKEEGTWWAG